MQRPTGVGVFAKFAQYSLRQVAANIFNAKAEPKESRHPFRQDIPHKDFLEMIAPVFSKACDDED
eukprot:4052426-Lingulodinium_polyedra.AAC.1